MSRYQESDLLEDISTDSDNENIPLSNEILQQPVAYAFEPVNNVPNQLAEPENADELPDLALHDMHVDFDRRADTDWCVCGNCHMMPTNLECVCCHEIDRIHQRIPVIHGETIGCIRDNVSFHNVCLNVEVLDVALLLMQDVRADNTGLVRPIPSRCVT